MCHATSAGRKAGSVSTNKSQFEDTLSTNRAYQGFIIIYPNNQPSKLYIYENKSHVK